MTADLVDPGGDVTVDVQGVQESLEEIAGPLRICLDHRWFDRFVAVGAAWRSGRARRFGTGRFRDGGRCGEGRCCPGCLAVGGSDHRCQPAERRGGRAVGVPGALRAAAVSGVPMGGVGSSIPAFATEPGPHDPLSAPEIDGGSERSEESEGMVRFGSLGSFFAVALASAGRPELGPASGSGMEVEAGSEPERGGELRTGSGLASAAEPAAGVEVGQGSRSSSRPGSLGPGMRSRHRDQRRPGGRRQDRLQRPAATPAGASAAAETGAPVASADATPTPGAASGVSGGGTSGIARDLGWSIGRRRSASALATDPAPGSPRSTRRPDPTRRPRFRPRSPWTANRRNRPRLRGVTRTRAGVPM